MQSVKHTAHGVRHRRLPHIQPLPYRLAAGPLLVLALAAGMVGGALVDGALLATRENSVRSNPALPCVPAVVATTGSVMPRTSTVVDAVGPAVVEVNAWTSTPTSITPCAVGSGFVADASGEVLTSYHLVAQANTIQLHFADGAARSAKLRAADRRNDIALLNVELPADVPPASLGDSDTVQVGDTVIAIGHPFGLEGSVSQGIVSGIHRQWQDSAGQRYPDMLQTDTALNPGNSGGPLLNASGQVIGIAAALQSPIAGSVGVGFAVPINYAKPLLEDNAQ